MADYSSKLAKAVQYFWKTRSRQHAIQGKVSGKRDAGNRAAVVGGAHCDGFATLIREILFDNGINDAEIFYKRAPVKIDAKLKPHSDKGTQLPGYFRATKEWDLVVVVNGELIATLEFKSQVGPSFGNNFNNRTEEALGSATDIWAAYKHGAFKPSSRPWLGYFMLLEMAPASTAPVKVREPHFKSFPEFYDASYAKRYELFCERLVRERLYDSACLVMSSSAEGIKGYYHEPSIELSFANFATSLAAKALAFSKR